MAILASPIKQTRTDSQMGEVNTGGQAWQPAQKPRGTSKQAASPMLRPPDSTHPRMFASDRLHQVMANNSPLLRQARVRSDEQMQRRGLLNSSIALGAAEDAAYRAAVPLAAADAQMANQHQLLGRQQRFAADQAAKAREQQTGVLGQQQRFAGHQAHLQRQFAADQAQIGRDWQATENALNRALQRYGIDQDVALQRELAEMRDLTARYGVDQGVAAQTLASVMESVGALASTGEMTATQLAEFGASQMGLAKAVLKSLAGLGLNLGLTGPNEGGGTVPQGGQKPDWFPGTQEQWDNLRRGGWRV